MGIPHLTPLLQPYSTPTILGCKTPQCKLHPTAPPRSLIIDGPALAYHVYHKLLAHKPERLGALDAVPSYGEMGEAVLGWLGEVEGFGVGM